MVDMFRIKMCNYCKHNGNCNYYKIEKNVLNKKTIEYKCNSYLKDTSKIIPYQKPLLVTAKRDYIK